MEELDASDKMKELLKGTLCKVERRMSCNELPGLCVFEGCEEFEFEKL